MFIFFKRVFSKIDLFDLFFYPYMIAISLGAILLVVEGEHGFIKEEMKKNIVIAVNNGADLDTVKHIFLNKRVISTTGVLGGSKKSELYEMGEPLSNVLNDIKSDLFMRSVNSTELALIDNVIKEYGVRNPFDKLEVGQKNYFENIQQKLGDEYGVIQSDVNNIADQLQHQNRLVMEYLADSTKSFYISIIALIFSVVVGVVQLWHGKRKRGDSNAEGS
ncbi:hypothetical protein [Desulfovibrio sp. JC010]|uniref:hypothetical protein n=1 Tax=Desulfovibrio sp. JC010 TaxID=2593641 RepID=UPI0013D5B69A|nr:hypothetical protein [Desulfovibrio sp. JC010]NDV28928.1 hypothetical protein [Desulfovibrio sp. JC010]